MDAFTKVANLVIQPKFIESVVKESVKVSKFYRSGITSRDPAIQRAANDVSTGGRLVNLPYYDAMDSGTIKMEPIKEDGTPLTIHRLSMGQDIAIATRRGVAIGWTDLARALASGKDPMEALKIMLAKFLAEARQEKLIATLNGVFANNVTDNDSDLFLDLTAGKTLTTDATKLTPTTFIDAAQMLGDHKTLLTGLAMHSMVSTVLSKMDAPTDGSSGYRAPSEASGNLATYNGRGIIDDDGIALGTYEANGKKCTYADIYLFGRGAVAEASVGVAEQEVEPFREPLKSQGGLIIRDGNIMHVRGIKYAGASGDEVEDTALATGSNWERVWDKKDIRVVKVRANLAIVPAA